MSVEVANRVVYPPDSRQSYEPESSSGDTEEFIKSVKDSLQRGRYDTATRDGHYGVVGSEDEQPSLPSDYDLRNGSSEHGGSLVDLVDFPNSDDEQSRWLSPDPPTQGNMLRVKQMSPGSDDIVLSYPRQLVNNKRENGDNVVELQLLEDENRQPAEAREEKDLLSEVLDGIPDIPNHAHSIAPPMPSSAEIANMLVRQKMQQELQNTRESIFQLEQTHQQEVAKLNEMLEAVKLERRNDRNQLQQKISTLQKELESAKRKTKNLSRDHNSSMERAKEASSLAHKIETESIQVKLTTEHELEVNKLKKAHRTEISELHHQLKEKEQELKLANQKLKEQGEGLVALQLQLEECRRDNQLRQAKLKEELTSKNEQHHRQVKKEKSLAVARAVEEANQQKIKELHELQQKCHEDKMTAISKLEKKFCLQLEEAQKKDHGSHPPTPREGGVASRHVEKLKQEHSAERVKWQQREQQLEQELQQARSEVRLTQQREKEVSHQHNKENKAISMEIMEECHKMSTLLMKRIRSGKAPPTNCWAAIVQLKNINAELSTQLKGLRAKIDQEKQTAIKTNRERMSEIRKLQKGHRRGKSPEEQQLEREVSTLREHLTILNKEHLLLEGKINKTKS
ncbi:trichohyalin-like isoform X2 [Dysidea avara]|uniref:trichohyalin-like isoform X2 n=1 Tax=Dysidea avara TaxID=196820 RepID=UPI0033249955